MAPCVLFCCAKYIKLKTALTVAFWSFFFHEKTLNSFVMAVLVEEIDNCCQFHRVEEALWSLQCIFRALFASSLRGTPGIPRARGSPPLYLDADLEQTFVLL